MQNLSALTNIAANLKVDGQNLAKVHFEHIPREHEVIKFTGGKAYYVKSVIYNVQKNPGGDVTCESIDVVLTEGSVR
jgi:hypothetical protein